MKIENKKEMNWGLLIGLGLFQVSYFPVPRTRTAFPDPRSPIPDLHFQVPVPSSSVKKRDQF